MRSKNSSSLFSQRPQHFCWSVDTVSHKLELYLFKLQYFILKIVLEKLCNQCDIIQTSYQVNEHNFGPILFGGTRKGSSMCESGTSQLVHILNVSGCAPSWTKSSKSLPGLPSTSRERGEMLLLQLNPSLNSTVHRPACMGERVKKRRSKWSACNENTGDWRCCCFLSCMQRRELTCSSSISTKS